MKERKWGVLITTFATLYIVIEALLYAAYGTVSITINNRPFFMKGEVRVSTALRRTGYRIRPGNLLDQAGRLVLKGGGGKPRIYMNGRKAKGSDVVKRDAKIVFIPGRDMKEKTRERLVDIPARTAVFGSGIFVDMRRQGVAGKRLEVFNAKNGEVIIGRVVAHPRPAIVQRSNFPLDKKVALTFDDGPNPPYTQQILNILREEQVPATFFVTGLQVKKYPEVVQETNRAGYAIENHSMTHSRLDRLDPEAIEDEIDQAQFLIEQAVGSKPSWFRVPYGKVNPLVSNELARRGYKLATWNIDPLDWKASSPDFILQQVMAQTRPGGVIILHDGGGNRANTVAVLPRIIRYLRDQGYVIVTLDELFGEG